MKSKGSTTVKLEALREAADRNPDSVQAKLRLGTVLVKVGFVKEGERVLSEAVSLDESCIQAWINLGGARLAQWNFTGCIEANQNALAVQPDCKDAYFNKGLGHLYLGQIEPVLECFERVVELDPSSGAGHYHLALGLHAAGDNARARFHLAQAISLGFSPAPEFIRDMEKVGGGPVEPVPIVEIESD